MAFKRTEPQHWEDIVRRTVVRRFEVVVGRCRQCGRRVQGRPFGGAPTPWNGARTQGILASLLRTCRQQGKDTLARLVGLLRSPGAEVLDLVPKGPSP